MTGTNRQALAGGRRGALPIHVPPDPAVKHNLQVLGARLQGPLAHLAQSRKRFFQPLRLALQLPKGRDNLPKPLRASRTQRPLALHRPEVSQVLCRLGVETMVGSGGVLGRGDQADRTRRPAELH